MGWQPLQQRTFADLLKNLVQESSLPHLLRYEDRNAMAFGVEARVPFLDYRLVEYSFRQAFHWCVHKGWAKWVLRAAMSGLVPDEILWRKAKVGFWTPESEWIQQWLANDPDLFCPAVAERPLSRSGGGAREPALLVR